MKDAFKIKASTSDVWLALLAPIYIISPLIMGFLITVKHIPSNIRIIVGLYAVLQVVPAFFTDSPILNLLTSILRVTLVSGGIFLGYTLKEFEKLTPFMIGLTVVFITAFVYSSIGGFSLLDIRLQHPYITSTALGLGGLLYAFLALSLRSKNKVKYFLFLIGLTVMILSGSRGVLAAFLFGGIITSIRFFDKKNFKYYILVILIAFSTIFFVKISPLEGVNNRIFRNDLSGRQSIWLDAQSMARTYGIFGVGNYRFGSLVSLPSEKCELVAGRAGESIDCPRFLSKFSRFWLIAHSLILHQIVETGIVGLSGTIFIIILSLTGALSSRSIYLIGSIFSMIFMNIFDNTIIPPSAFHAEIFWIICGMGLYEFNNNAIKLSILPVLTCALLFIPIFLLFSSGSRNGSNNPLRIDFLYAPNVFDNNGLYRISMRISGAEKNVTVLLRDCKLYCRTIDQAKVKAGSSDLISLKGYLSGRGNHKMEIIFISEEDGVKINVLGDKKWDLIVN